MATAKSTSESNAPELLKFWITVHHEAMRSHIDAIVSQCREGIAKVITEELAPFKSSQARQAPQMTTAVPTAGVQVNDGERRKAIDLRTALLLGKIPEDAGLLIDTRTTAQLLNVSSRTLTRLHQLGAVPDPVRIGGKIIRWRLAELLAWIEADCPPKKHWSYSPSQQKRRK